MKMHVFTIEISRDTMDKVRDAFYKKDGLEKLVTMQSINEANKNALNIVADKYAAAYTEWQIEMANIERDTLKTRCGTFAYEYTMDFLNSKMTLVTSATVADSALLAALESYGFEKTQDISTHDPELNLIH